jgi:hypothetical protein
MKLRLIIPGGPTYRLIPGGLLGPRGKSAYQVAVDNGFIGTEQEWLDSLQDYANLTNLPSTFPPSAHTHLSADITDATPNATPNTVVKRSSGGSASFLASDLGSAVNAAAQTEAIAINASSASGDALYAFSETGTAVNTYAPAGFGVQAWSGSSSGLLAVSVSGTNHAEFGESANDRSFIRRVLGLIGWHRGSFTQTLGSPATLTANSALTLPDAASGTLALTASTSGIPDNLVTSSTKTTPIDADSVLITDSEAAGTPAKRLTFTNLWTWITTKLGALTSLTAGGAWAFSSTTRPTSSGTGTPANNSLITRDDGDLRYDRHVAQQQGRANFSWANGAFNLYNAGSNSQFQAVPSRMRIIKSIFVEWGLTAEALNTNFEVRVFWNSRKANNIAGGGSAQIISGTVSLVAGSGDAWRYRFTAENITIDSVAVNDADGTGFYTIDIRVRNDTGGSLTTSTDVRHLAFIEFGVV